MRKCLKGRAVKLMLPVGIMLVSVQGGLAQDRYSSGTMWGTTTAPNSVDSAYSHYLDGQSAGMVNAARDGILYGDGSILSITSIGSQNVVSNTVINSDNVDIDNNADQTSTNSGDVTTDGTFHYTPTTIEQVGGNP